MDKAINQTYLAAIKNNEHNFRNLINQRFGINIRQTQIKDFENTILTACMKFNYHPNEYYDILTQSVDDSPIIEHLISCITVGETYFFRDKNQIELLQEKILPEIIKLKRQQGIPSLRIWSAGSSSGEEIYTIAMMLHELLPDIKNWALHLLGTDINIMSLHKAVKGVYSEWSMRSISEYYLKKYFTHVDKNYVLSDKIRNMVTFEYLNLSDNNYPSIYNGTNAQDLILCRNVLIYFDMDHVSELMKKINNSLSLNGYLLLGASDPIRLEGTDLSHSPSSGTLFIRPPHVAKSVTQPQTTRTAPSTTASIAKKARAEKKPAIKTKSVSQIDNLNQLVDAGKWEEILESMELSTEKETAASLNIKAIAQANLGDLEAALQSSQKCLMLDATNKVHYITHALILTELNRFHEAENALRKTIFLDHRCVEGHFQLGLLLLRNKQHAAGLRSLRNALSIANKESSTELVPGFKDLQYGRLAEILKHEIEIYSESGV